MNNPDMKVRNDKVEKALNDIGQTIAQAVPLGYGFTLLIYTLGEYGSMFYLSNANRKDMIDALKEMIQKLEVTEA